MTSQLSVNEISSESVIEEVADLTIEYFCNVVLNRDTRFGFDKGLTRIAAARELIDLLSRLAHTKDESEMSSHGNDSGTV